MAQEFHDIGYRGWYVLETGRRTKDIVADTRANIEYVKRPSGSRRRPGMTARGPDAAGRLLLLCCWPRAGVNPAVRRAASRRPDLHVAAGCGGGHRRRPRRCRGDSLGAAVRPSTRRGRAAYRAATARIEQRASVAPAGAVGVVLDARRDRDQQLQYQVGAWDSGTPRRPVPAGCDGASLAAAGCGGFSARVRAPGCGIAIVTNRLESECTDTIAVFKTQGLPFDAMLCRPEQGPSDKNPRGLRSGRRRHDPGGFHAAHRSSAFLGETPGLSGSARLPAGGRALCGSSACATSWLPNPMYGSWETNR